MSTFWKSEWPREWELAHRTFLKVRYDLAERIDEEDSGGGCVWTQIFMRQRTTWHALARQFHRLLSVYRQCRYNFHVFSTSINSFSPAAGITPSILMALSNERWPTFCEMFPGIKEDVLEDYGLAVQLKLPGKHIAMINRCLGNRDATFTGAIKRCVNAIKTRLMPDFCAILTPILSHAYVLTAGSCEIPLQMCGGGPSTCQSHMRL